MSRYLYVLITLHTVSWETPAQPSENVEAKTLLAIFAHADDESLVSPILARYSREGVKVHLIIATDGSWGVRAHANIAQGAPLAEARAGEARCVSSKLGIHPPILLGIEDGTLGKAESFSQLHVLLDSLLDQLNPDAIITWDPGGYYGHIDHRMVSNVVTELCQEPRQRPIDGLFYFSAPHIHLTDLPELKSELANGLISHLLPTRRELITHSISYSSEDKEAAYKAFQCHKSQFTAQEMEDLFMVNTMEDKVHFRAAFGIVKNGDSLFAK